MPLFAYDFWNRVDKLKGDIKLTKIAEDTGINYQTLRNQRSENRFPKNDDITRIAKYLNTTEEYLMTGTQGSPSIQSTSFDYVEDAMTKDAVLADILASLIKQIKGEN